MRSSVLLVAILASALAGCATNRYVGPTSGRSADTQWGVSRAVDQALGAVDWERVRGRTAGVSVATLTESYGGQSAEEGYLEAAVRGRVLAAGARLAEGGPPEVEVRVLARVLGVNRTRRDFIPLYYSELLEGVAELDVVFLENGGIATERRSATASRRRTYLFYMFGPLVKEWSE